MDFAIGNEGTGESNGDAKVGLKVKPNIATMALVSYWLTTTTDTLVPTFLVPISVCRLLIFIYSSRPPLL